MLTNDDIKAIEVIVNKVVSNAVTPLVTKNEAKNFATKDDLKETEERLMKAIKKEHKIGGDILQICEVEDRKIRNRVVKIENHLGFASA